MYKKTISGLSIVAAAFGLAAFSSPASAACTTDTNNVWECLEVAGVDRTDMGLQGVGGNKNGTNPFTFEGPASLQHWFVGTLNCTLKANGYAGVNTSANQADVEVTALTSTGSGNCGLVSFGGLPLMAFDGDGDMTPGLSGGNGDVYNKHGSVHNAHGTLGSTGASATLEVYYDGTLVCDDSVALEFGNDVTASGDKDKPSFFTFDDTMSGWGGSCTVQGTLDTEKDSDGTMYTDVNAW